MAEQAQIIRWEEPPPARSIGVHKKYSRYEAIADQLRARPGDWAVVLEKPGSGSGLAAHIRMGQMYCFTPAGYFDACTRQHAGVATVYARYLGDGGGDV